jgi:hypothetical protein
MLFDLHVHSNNSPDALTKPETVIKICKKKGFGVSITDHASMGAYSGKNNVLKFAKKQGVFLVPGEELRVLENGKYAADLIAYFLNEEIPPKTFSETLDDVKSQGALLSCPHPFDWPRTNFKGFPKHWKKFDCVEVFNARAYYDGLNETSRKFAAGKKISQLGVSDAHTPEEIGNGLTEIEARTETEFRKEIKKQRTKVIMKGRAGLWHHLQTQLAERDLVKDK